MKITGKILIAFFALALVACGNDVESANLTKVPATEAAQVQKKLSNPGNMDMSRVHTLRLRVDGERLDIVSLTPSTIAKSGSAENEFATIFAFSEDRKSVELFSRDPKTERV